MMSRLRGFVTGKQKADNEAGSGRWTVRFLLWFVLLCAVASGLNVAVNPYGIYATRLINPIVWSDRREKLDLLQHHPGRADILILGSSRMMRVSPSDLRDATGLDGFNLAVNHARTEDFLALLRYAVLKLDKCPRAVIVGLDIHAFRGYYQADNLLEYYPELAYYIRSEERNSLLYPLTVNWTKFARSLSFHQLEKSVTSLARFCKMGHWQSSYRFERDGTLSFNSAEDIPGDNPAGHLPETWLDEAVERYIRDSRGFGGISDTRLDYFRRLASFCREMDIELVCVFLPYQPEFLQRLQGTEFDRLNTLWKRSMIELTAYERVKLLDAQDISVFRGDPEQFYDEIHMTPSNSSRLAGFIAVGSGLEVDHSF